MCEIPLYSPAAASILYLEVGSHELIARLVPEPPLALSRTLDPLLAPLTSVPRRGLLDRLCAIGRGLGFKRRQGAVSAAKHESRLLLKVIICHAILFTARVCILPATYGKPKTRQTPSVHRPSRSNAKHA